MGTFPTHDGVELTYTHWPAAGPAPAGWPERPALIMLHRGHEHAGRLQHVVDGLDLAGVDAYAYDARGHGRSPGPRGHAPSFGTLVRDLDAFVAHVCRTQGHPVEQVAVVAPSVGAVVAAAWVHDFAPRLRGLVLAAPAFSVRLYVPLARQGLAFGRMVRGNFSVTSYVKGRHLTSDPERIASYEADPLVAKVISVDILLGLFAAGKRLVADARAIRTPTQLLISGSDWVVHRKPQLAFFEALGAKTKELKVLEGFLHDTLGERRRDEALHPARAFLDRIFRAPLEDPDRTAEDRAGAAHDDYQRLLRPLPPFTPAGLAWGLQRLFLRTTGRLSDGIAIGCRQGFDSGASLDHVYGNRARGRLLVGRVVDRIYLDSPGWRGVRIRRAHLEELLRKACALVSEGGHTPRLLDPAAGHGRYLLDVLKDLSGEALLRDLDPDNVARGRTRIGELGMDGRVRFDQGDGFDAASLAALGARFNIAAVSGFYELFNSNDQIRQSLAGLSAALEPGGWLIYTNQPWHPQLKLIARLLSSHRKTPWVMRCRSQREMDQLVAEAGFDKVEQRVDEAGIFTVSLARRRA